MSSMSPTLRRGIFLIYVMINELDLCGKSKGHLLISEALSAEVMVAKGWKTGSNACIVKT